MNRRSFLKQLSLLPLFYEKEKSRSMKYCLYSGVREEYPDDDTVDVIDSRGKKVVSLYFSGGDNA